MTDLFPEAPKAVSLERQLEGARRESSFRRRVYARRIADGKMTQTKADEEIAVMDAIGSTLCAHTTAVEALRAIAAGDGQYGAQAAEYKELARGALTKMGLQWPGREAL